MNREVQRLRDSAQTAQELNGDYGVPLNWEVERVHGGVQSRDSLTAIVAVPLPESSEALRLGSGSRKLRGFCGDWDESGSWQVVGISLEDAISRKAIGSPD